jgi:FkbM family methyltransferase
MNAQKTKTILIKIMGEKLVARIQGLRFAYINTVKPLPDPEVKLVPRFAAQGGVAIDVGANGANWTKALHAVVGDSGRVFAFEADPYYALATQHAIRIMRMKGVRLFPFGLSDKDEEIPLRIRDEANQRVSGLGFIDRDAKRGDRDVTLVRLRTLDSMIPGCPELLRTSLLKCDVEGYEWFVFRGAQQVISTARPAVILEIGNFEKQGYSAGDIHAFFKEKNYEPFAMVEGGVLMRTDAMLHHPMAASVNRVLIPAEKLESVRDLVRDGA